MDRRHLVFGLVAFAGTPALASAPQSGAEREPPHVDLAPIGLPVVVEGRLANYVFVSLRLWAAPSADLTVLRSREPLIRDALVRAAHRRSLAVATDPTRIDEAALDRALTPELARVAGRGAVRRIQVTAQVPQRRSGFTRR